MKMKEEVRIRYFDAPDLQHVGKNAYRFINAVSDFVTHSKPLKERTNYKENLFARTIDGNTLTDRAYEINTPELANCTPMSFIAALLNCSQLGMEPNTKLEHWKQI